MLVKHVRGGIGGIIRYRVSGGIGKEAAATFRGRSLGGVLVGGAHLLLSNLFFFLVFFSWVGALPMQHPSAKKILVPPLTIEKGTPGGCSIGVRVWTQGFNLSQIAEG